MKQTVLLISWIDLYNFVKIACVLEVLLLNLFFKKEWIWGILKYFYCFFTYFYFFLKNLLQRIKKIVFFLAWTDSYIYVKIIYFKIVIAKFSS